MIRAENVPELTRSSREPTALSSAGALHPEFISVRACVVVKLLQCRFEAESSDEEELAVLFWSLSALSRASLEGIHAESAQVATRTTASGGTANAAAI